MLEALSARVVRTTGDEESILVSGEEARGEVCNQEQVAPGV